MNIARFEMNVPTPISLMSPQGTRIEGRYGDQVMFTLADGRVMYVPPTVAAKIEAEGIGAGEPFELCKARIRVGRRQMIEWHLKKGVSEPEQAVPPSDPPAARETQLESDLRRSIQLVSARKENGSTPPHVPPPNGEGGKAAAVNGNGQAAPITKLEHALKTAISAAYNAERYGAELGYVVRFDADAIKSMAITVLINMSEGGRR